MITSLSFAWVVGKLIYLAEHYWLNFSAYNCSAMLKNVLRCLNFLLFLVFEFFEVLAVTGTYQYSKIMLLIVHL